MFLLLFAMVGIALPTVEVRFEHLTIKADCYIGNRALPSLVNATRNIAESALGLVGIRLAERTELTILKDASGMIKPSRQLQWKELRAASLLTTPLGQLTQSCPYARLVTSISCRRHLNPSVGAGRENFLRASHPYAPDVPWDLANYCISTELRGKNSVELAIERHSSSGSCPSSAKVTSRKDQEQYWADRSRPYNYVIRDRVRQTVPALSRGPELENELSVPYAKARSHKAALVYKKYCVPKKELLKASFDKEWLLIKRNSFVYVFKTVQIIIVAIIAATVFLRTEMHTGNEGDGAIYVGALLFTMIINMFNGFAELSLTIQRLPVFYKQRDLLFHPPWAFTLPTFLLRIPISVLEFFKQLLVVFLIQQTAAGIFRLIAGVCRTMIIANTGGALTLLLVFLLGGFILPKDQIPKWWQWGYWVSPMTYCFNALAVNEMFAPRWMNQLASDNVTPLGVAVLKNFQVFPNRNWFWIGTAALFGFAVLLNILFTLALMYLNPIGKPQAIISKEAAREMEADQEETKEAPRIRINRSKIDSLPQSLSSTDGNNTSKKHRRLTQTPT
ncbi:pleiotropic drug resistance 7 [Actinidia rufa]|uniref:Pleiotropic drug resistance 7 n=1 Tax=Actinidia rufa TaxID=165716 RepID=A0A7J0FEF2_9ERIC|nr:pleiotropic drug resistance 7 [Actinidia rufa]